MVCVLAGAVVLMGMESSDKETSVANWYNVDTLTASPTQINFLVFTPLFTILSILYVEGAPRFLPKCT